jgi:hypothetical protein
MSILQEAKNARLATRERPDLSRQYRPIGIGAVAAALSATGRSTADNSNGRSSEQPEKYRYTDSMAA